MGEMVLYFTLYSWSGWVLENSFSYVMTRKFFKDNFLIGPFKPMYGFAPLLLILLIDEEMPWLLILFLCLTIPTLIEYVSGVLLASVFNKRYWDYSHMRYQLHGHICIRFSVCWLLLSFICIYCIHPLITIVYSAIDHIWERIYAFVFLYFTVEFMLAVKKHFGKQTLKEREEGI